jgi:RNase H-fold protein (predicted Holliday junction resolvase)
MPEPPVVGVDPGRGKCGLAVVFRSGEVVEQCVVPREKLVDTLTDMVQRHQAAAVVVGDRTGSSDACREIARVLACPVVTAPEHETTLRARDRFFRDHPPKGWRALVPRGLLTPPRPVDDYAAILLAEAWWNNARK